ncbi:PTS glucose transporter subunit IIA [Idiomarina ramblicola]|uniref:PTS glucose transporter subunit IIA n=1 Tax=Idiomarina ramblicola TaxID=263724 RepID=A0A432Z5E4_9GAMM|nr:PTS glucose transporter subunit IIA [Idiomarina ramblicola]
MWIQLHPSFSFATILPELVSSMVSVVATSKLPSLYAPVTGRVIAAQPTAAVCQQGLLGQGIVIEMTGSTLYAPADGELNHISSSGDYLSLRLNDTYSLQLVTGSGDAFGTHPALTVLCREQTQVKYGDPLVKINQSLLRSLKPIQQRLAVLVCAPDSAQPIEPFDWLQPGLITAKDSPLITY